MRGHRRSGALRGQRSLLRGRLLRQDLLVSLDHMLKTDDITRFLTLAQEEDSVSRFDTACAAARGPLTAQQRPRLRSHNSSSVEVSRNPTHERPSESPAGGSRARHTTAWG